MKLTPAHRELIRLLAAVAVEQFLAEGKNPATNNLLHQETTYDTKRPHRGMNPARPTKGAAHHDDTNSTPTPRRKKAHYH